MNLWVFVSKAIEEWIVYIEAEMQVIGKPMIFWQNIGKTGKSNGETSQQKP